MASNGGCCHPNGVGRQRLRMGRAVGHTMQGVPEYAREYFSEAERTESSTCRELIRVLRCLQSVVHLCAGKFVVFRWTRIIC